jgi:acetoin utilization deacetylase AcuC-like enzyme
MHIITDERCLEYRTPGHPERPTRVSRTIDLLKTQQVLTLEWVKPDAATDEVLLRAHPRGYLDRLVVAEDFDGDTAFHPGIGDHARRGVGGALKAMELAMAGKPAFSLLRPPGHHATRHSVMGFCYLGSMAIAALHARATGVERVGLFDFDVHHGNGTEDIVSGKPGIVFASVHQHPCYPGSGTSDVGGNCFNFPVAPKTPREQWRTTLRRALDRVLESKPQVLGVSAGFDAYVRDPLANGTLEREDFHWMGTQLRETKLPVFSILEGGYSLDLPDLVYHYLLGLEGKPFK